MGSREDLNRLKSVSLVHPLWSRSPSPSRAVGMVCPAWVESNWSHWLLPYEVTDRFQMMCFLMWLRLGASPFSPSAAIRSELCLSLSLHENHLRCLLFPVTISVCTVLARAGASNTVSSFEILLKILGQSGFWWASSRDSSPRIGASSSLYGSPSSVVHCHRRLTTPCLVFFLYIFGALTSWSALHQLVFLHRIRSVTLSTASGATVACLLLVQLVMVQPMHPAKLPPQGALRCPNYYPCYFSCSYLNMCWVWHVHMACFTHDSHGIIC